MKKKIIWIGIILVIVLGIAGYKIKLGNQAMAVETEKVQRGDIEEYIEETGNVILEEETEVFASTSGKVIEVLKKAGEEVKAGDILVKLDSSDLLLQIKALEAQRLSVSAKYAGAKTRTDGEELKKLNAQVRSAEASYEESKRTADSSKVLYESGAISLETYKASATKLAAAEAGLQTAKSNLAIASKGLPEYESRQYEAQLTELQAKIEQLKIKLEEMEMKAPISGLLMAVKIQKGSIVQPGTKLIDIGGSKGLYIESNILIEDMRGVKIGSTVKIEDEDLGISNMTGTVRKIYPKAESILSNLGIEQKRVKVEISLNNPVDSLRPGYDMTVRIITRSKKDALLIAEKAIFNYKGQDHVFVNENGTAKLRAIEKGLKSHDLAEVQKGLAEGEEVVLSPDKALEEGTKIKKSN